MICGQIPGLQVFSQEMLFSPIFEEQEKFVILKKYSRAGTFLKESAIRDSISHSAKTLEIIRDNKKIFLSLGVGPYHMTFNTFIIIYYLNKYLFKPEDGVEFIVDISTQSDNDRDNRKFGNFLDMMLTFCKLSNINVTIINTYDYFVIKTNNFIIQNDTVEIPNSVYREFSDWVKLFVSSSGESGRKTYLSRSAAHQTEYTSRLDNEKIVEDFLKTYGFEVDAPENYDNNLDLASRIKDSSVLCSVTSSGMTNMIFLKPGALVIELQTPINFIVGNGEYERRDLHLQYESLAYALGLRYVKVSNFTNNSHDVIREIKKTIEDYKTIQSIFSQTAG
jgi:hypothetical protein